MALGINKNNPENKITANFDNVMYQYNGFEWVRCEPTRVVVDDEWVTQRANRLHKYYDVSSTSEFNDEDMINGDYIATYKTNGNFIKGSELLTDKDGRVSPWTKNNTTVNENRAIIMPNNKDYCFAVYSTRTSEIVEHNLSQGFITKPGKYYCFSCYAQPIPNRETSKVGLSIYLDSYDLNLCFPFDVNDSTGFINGYKYFTSDEIIFRNSTGTTTNIDNVFSEYSAGLQLIPVVKKDDLIEYFYRAFLITRINVNSAATAKYIQLNHTDDWMFSETENQYGNYISGFQMEIDDALMNKPTSYINVPSRDAQIRRTFDVLYKYNNGSYELQPDKKVYYLDNVTEKFISTKDDQGHGIEYTKIESSVPEITNPSRNEIAVVSSVITFTLDDKYTAEESIAGVVLGNNYSEEDPYYTIYYDKFEKVYKIKVPYVNWDGSISYEYLKFAIKSEENIHRIITKSLIYNQGYFETYNEYSNFKPDFIYGFNSGGNCNFWKLKYLHHNKHTGEV